MSGGVSPGGLGGAGGMGGGGSVGVVSPGGVGGAGGAGSARHHINSEDDKDAAMLARRVLDFMDTCAIGDML